MITALSISIHSIKTTQMTILISYSALGKNVKHYLANYRHFRDKWANYVSKR